MSEDPTQPRGPEQGQVAVPIPEDYDAAERAAFKRGFQACAELFGTAAATYAAAVSDDQVGDDEPPTECPNCGSDLLDSMGAAETATPAGTVCPECDL